MKIIMRYLPVVATGFSVGFAIGICVFMWAYSSI